MKGKILSAIFGFSSFFSSTVKPSPLIARSNVFLFVLKGSFAAGLPVFVDLFSHRLGAEQDRDLKFFDAVLLKLKSDYQVDKSRTYATGNSNGGNFTYLLWSQRGEVFASVARSAAVAPNEVRMVANHVSFTHRHARHHLARLQVQQALLRSRSLSACRYWLRYSFAGFIPVHRRTKHYAQSIVPYQPEALIPHGCLHFLGFLENGMWKSTACRRYVVRLQLGKNVILNQNTC